MTSFKIYILLLSLFLASFIWIWEFDRTAETKALESPMLPAPLKAGIPTDFDTYVSFMSADQLQESLNSENPYIKSDAIEYLERDKSAASVIKLRNLLFDPSPSVIIETTTALGRLSDASAVEDLMKTFEQNRVRIDGYGEPIRESIIDALGKIGSEEAVPLLGEEFTAQGSILYRDHIVDALANIGGKEATYYLEQYLQFLLDNPPPSEWQDLKHVWTQAIHKIENTIAFIQE